MGQPYRSNQRHTASKTPSGKRCTWASTTGGSPSGSLAPSSSPSAGGGGRPGSPGASHPALPRQAGSMSEASVSEASMSEAPRGLLLLGLRLLGASIPALPQGAPGVGGPLQPLGLDEIGDLGAHLAEHAQGLGQDLLHLVLRVRSFDDGPFASEQGRQLHPPQSKGWRAPGPLSGSVDRPGGKRGPGHQQF